MSTDSLILSQIGRTTLCSCFCHALGDICQECGQDRCDGFSKAQEMGL